MTIIPSLRRTMKRKKNIAGYPRAFACQELEGRRLLAIDINVGAHNLLPNTPGQVIEITATSDDPANDLVTAMNLDAQLGDGDLASSTSEEPNFTDVEFLGGTVWDGQPTVTITPEMTTDAPQTGDSGEPSYLSANIVLGNVSTCQADPDTGENACDFAPNGVIARLVIDTTDFSSGTFPLLLSGGDSLMTNFAESLTGNIITPNITNGSITIVNSDPIADPVVSPADQYTIDFGGSLTLNGSESSDPDQPQGDSITSYEWDINSATFGFAEAAGVSPTLSWSQLNDLGITTPGTYDVTLRVTDSLEATDTATVSLVVEPATVEGRHVFYNGSFFDNNPGVGRDDNNAVATDKEPLLPGGTATFANYTSYLRGLNGVMVDVSNIPDPGAIDASDFSFATGNTADPDTWTGVPPTPTVSVHPGEGEDGTDRIKLIWDDSSIVKTWLEITVEANADTGLQADDVFYFGNIPGDTGFGNPSNEAIVNFTDASAVFGNGNFDGDSPADNQFDMNRDGSVNFTDASILFGNGAFPGDGLVLFTPSSNFTTSRKSEGEPQLPVARDINGDGKITLADALAVVSVLRKQLLSNESLVPDVESQGDIDTGHTADSLALGDALAIVATLRESSKPEGESLVLTSKSTELLDGIFAEEDLLSS